MRNVILLAVVLEASDKPVSDSSLVATFTLTASHKNTDDATLSDAKGAEVLVPAGGQYRFEGVDLADLRVRGKEGEKVFVVGHSV